MTPRLARSSFLASIPLAAVVVPCGVRAQGLATVRVGATANDTYAEAYYGVDSGIFAKNGLDCPITTFANGAAVSAAVAGGSLDVGISNPVQLANAIAHHVPFVYFVGGGLYDTNAPTTVIAVAKDGPVRVPKDLEGKTVANSTLKDLTYLATVGYLKKNGVDIDKVQMTEMPFAEMGPALQRGTVGAAIISEPSLTSAILAGQARVLGKVFDVIAPRFLISGWFTTKDWLAKNPDRATRYQRAIYDVARWANANQEKSGEILAKYSKITPEVMQHMTRCRYSESLTPALLDPALQLAASAKITERLVTGEEMIAKV